MEKVHFLHIHDLTNPKTGNTFKEDNLAKNHKYKVGDLVEIITDEKEPSKHDGIRLYVIGNVRDCDGTPLYRLGLKGMNLYENPNDDRFYNYKSYGSYSEDCLNLIKKFDGTE